MWPAATKRVSQLPGLSSGSVGDYAPFTVLHKRISTAADPDGSACAGAAGLAWQLGSPSVFTPGQQQWGRPTAVQQVFAEWSRIDLPTSALGASAQQHQVMPRYSTWWDPQDMQMLQSLLQDPQPDNKQATPATPPNSALNDTIPAQLEQQRDRLLWAVQACAAAQPGKPAAGIAAAEPAIDALLDDCAAGLGPASAQQPQQERRMSPFAMPDAGVPAGALAEPPELQLPQPMPLHLPAVLGPNELGVPAFLSPVSGLDLGPADVPQRKLHAPELLPGYRLPTPVTACSISHTPHTNAGPTPTCSASGQGAAVLTGMASDGLLLQGWQAEPVSGNSHRQSPWQEDLPAGQFHTSTAAGMAANSPSTAAAAHGVQHVSPFLMMNPWDLQTAVDPSNPQADAINMAIAAQAAEAAAAASALAHGFWPMGMQDAGFNGQGVRGGRVQKGADIGLNGRKLHSSMKTKLQIKELQEQYEALTTEYEAEVSLNAVLQQRWNEVSSAYDSVLAQRMQRSATPTPSFLAAAAAAAAAASAHAADGAAAAAAIAAVPRGMHDSAQLDALAAALQTSWTNQLAQLVDLLPVLARSCTKSTGASPQPQPQAAGAAAAAAGAGAQALPCPGASADSQELCMADDLLPSPFATVCAASGARAAATGTSAPVPNPPALQQNAEAAALTALSMPWFMNSIRMADVSDDLSSPTDSDGSDSRGGSAGSGLGRPGSGTSSDSHGVKRRRGAAAAGNLCADLGLLLSSNLSLGMQPPSAKHARVDGSRNLGLTESDMRLLFSTLSSGPQSGLQQPQQGGQGASGAESASLAAAQLSAGLLYASVWDMFQQIGLSGPSLLYRCFGPRVVYCACCYSQKGVAGNEGSGQHSPRGLMALLLEDDAGSRGVCQDCMMGGQAGADTAAAGVAPGAGAGLGGSSSAQAVLASPAHWQRVRDCMALTPKQQARMQQLWSGLQNAHASFAAKRLAVLQELQQQFALTKGWAGIACYCTCHAGVAAAAETDQLLADVGSSMAADYGIFLEACRLLWGDESPLTLIQKVKCLVASYPFWPDHGLLECLALGSGSNGGQHAAAAVLAQR